MILVDRTKPEHRAALANVTHVDGTARVQTVDARWNAAFADLLAAFHAATGVPVLLNTSFNKRGQPIVETPAEAVALFAETALDALVMGEVLVVKADATSTGRARALTSNGLGGGCRRPAGRVIGEC